MQLSLCHTMLSSIYTHISKFPHFRSHNRILARKITERNQCVANPNPAMQLRYRLTRSWHSCCGLSLREKSMHSSRAAFSSLHTQQGFAFTAVSSPCGFNSVARFESVDVVDCCLRALMIAICAVSEGIGCAMEWFGALKAAL